jgi:hypothetical protein
MLAGQESDQSISAQSTAFSSPLAASVNDRSVSLSFYSPFSPNPFQQRRSTVESTDLCPNPTAATHAVPPSLAVLERSALRSRVAAWSIIVGLPALGFLASLFTGLSLFAAIMAASFLLATSVVCGKAMATYTGKLLRLLVAARLVIVVVAGAMLFCTSGSAWVAVVSAVVLWLAADRMLGRRALYDLWKLANEREQSSEGQL